MNRWRYLMALTAALLWPGLGWAADDDLVIRNALDYLRRQQAADGSFGRAQPHLLTGVVMLAVLSASAEPTPADRALLGKAARYLVETGSPGGDLGDEVFATESHALALVALLGAAEYLDDAPLKVEVSNRVQRGLNHLLRLQDRSGSSPARGGWKLEGTKGQLNDRRASGWALFAAQGAAVYGLPVPAGSFERGSRFMLGSYKETAPHPDQVGGFSVDTEGLAVDLISAMGGWTLARFAAPPGVRAKNLAWLARHPPQWTGPNWFYSNFFRSRALTFAQPETELARETRRRLLAQLSAHQQPEGSLSFPPGNAQNTVLMGPVYATAMAVLIAAAPDSRLPVDESYAPVPRF